MPRDTHDISAADPGSVVDILDVMWKSGGGCCLSNFKSWVRARDTRSAERTWTGRLTRYLDDIAIELGFRNLMLRFGGPFNPRTLLV